MQSFAVRTAAWMVAVLFGMGIAARGASRRGEPEQIAGTSGRWVRAPRPAALPSSRSSRECPLYLVGETRDLVVRLEGDSNIYVTHAFLDKALEQQAELMRSARLVPEQRDGRVAGVRIFGITPISMLARLGFDNGDVLLRISGYDMSSPDNALEAYARLRTSSELEVEILRAGRWMVLRYVLC